MSPSTHPEQLTFRADGPEPVEYWLVPETIPQSSANAWPETPPRCPEIRMTGPSCAMSDSCGRSKRVFPEVPGGPDQTQTA